MGVGHGAILQSYSYSGGLNWQVDGLGFVSLASIDPHHPDDAYDAYHHFKLDYSKKGNIGRYAGDTYQRFRYPDDVRVTSIASIGEIQYIQGRKFLLVSSQGGSYLEIDRFSNNEAGPEKGIAIPSAAFDYGSLNGQYQDFVVQPLNSEFMWRDTNGDGQMSMDEITVPDPTQNCTGSGCWRGGGYFSMDTDGDVWQVNYDRNIEPSIHLRRYEFQGFDAYGAPIYDYGHVAIYTAPADFSGLPDIESAVFHPHESDGGTLYAGGNQSTLGTFTEIQRTDNWDLGNRKAAWTINVPWDPDPNNQWQPNSFSVSGDYVFVDYYRPHVILIFSAKDGSYVGKFTPGSDIGGIGRTVNGDFLSPVGDTDEWQGISSFKRPNGEYVVINEDDFQAKQIIYRWTPGNVQPPPAPVPPGGLVATGSDEGVTLTWTGSSDALIYNVYRSNTKGGPYTLVDKGVVGNTVTDPGLTNGRTYYYVVSALTQTGPSAYSAEVAGTAVVQGTTYETEAAQLAGGAGIYPCVECSGGARVGAMGPGATITWNNVSVPAAGTYAVRVYVGNADNNPSDWSPLDITVNGSVQTSIAQYPYTGDYGIPAYTTVTLSLNAGVNTIVLGVPATSPNFAPDFDRILVPFKAN